MELVWIELSRDALVRNVTVLQEQLPEGCELAPCVKANAYGHGAHEVVSFLQEHGVKWLSLNSLREHASLQEAGLSSPALIMGYVPAEETPRLLRLQARPFVYDWERVRAMSRYAEERQSKLPVHVMVDTGMTRLGVFPEEARSFIEQLHELPGIYVEGIATHFANSDERENSSYFSQQLHTFEQVTAELEVHEICPPYIHCANSAVSLVQTLKVSQKLVRPGLSLFGEYPSEEVKANSQKHGDALDPVLSLKTRIVSLKWVEAGAFVGYDCTFQTARRSRIAVLPMGYADGFDRGLTNLGTVLVHGRRAPVVGRVSMNMTMIDVTDIEDVHIEDEVTVIGKEGEERITAGELARLIETNPYEIFARLRPSLPKFWR